MFNIFKKNKSPEIKVPAVTFMPSSTVDSLMPREYLSIRENPPVEKSGVIYLDFDVFESGKQIGRISLESAKNSNKTAVYVKDASSMTIDSFFDEGDGDPYFEPALKCLIARTIAKTT